MANAYAYCPSFLNTARVGGGDYHLCPSHHFKCYFGLAPTGLSYRDWFISDSLHSDWWHTSGECDSKMQMMVIFLGLCGFFSILSAFPESISFTKALKIAGASGKLNVLDFSFDTNSRYTLERHHRRTISCPILLWHRPISGTTLPLWKIT